MNFLQLLTPQLLDVLIEGVLPINEQEQHRYLELEQLLRLANTVIEHSPEGIFVTDDQCRIQYANPAFLQATGYDLEELLGQNPRLLQSGWHNRDFYVNMWENILSESRWSGEIWNRRKSGEIYPQWLAIHALRDRHGQVAHYAAVCQDMSRHKRNEEQIHHQAHHDALTGLPNRLLFLDRLQLAMQDAQRLDLRVGIMFIDLDRFKLINDTLGHARGDHLLQQVADRLQNHVGDRDTVARMGGDEFTVLLEHIEKPEDASKMARILLDAFVQPLKIGDEEYFITPSIGIALYPDDGAEMEELLRNADTAMYRAKERGNNYQHYTPLMNTQAQQRLALENDLHRAVDRQEFVVLYQPQIDLQSGEIIGMEALVRWQHQKRGFISPAEFIPLAEETGLIVPIGEWVLRTACAQTKTWLDKGYAPLRLGVNLSARQFQQQNLVELIDTVLQETGLPAHCLDLEITESITMDHVEQAITTLHSLRELGVHISIDDFGTGYSSFAYLRKFPIHTLKIDRSFVDVIPFDSDGSAIAASIIAMAHQLKLNVIAEGVETSEQLDFLRERQCNEMQGYLFSAPVSAEEFEALLTNGHRLNSQNADV